MVGLVVCVWVFGAGVATASFERDAREVVVMLAINALLADETMLFGIH